MQRRVSVVIPVRNDGSALPAAVQSVLAQRGATVDEVVIVVGPSADDSEKVAAELAAAHDVVHVVPNPSGMTPQALNLGAAHSRGDVVVRVDARSTLPVDYIANALESMERTGAGNIGAVQVPVGDTPTQRAIAAAMTSRVGSGGASYRHATELTQVDTAYLGVFRRDAFEDVGGFDETFVRNQDAELNTRLNAAGHQVWLDPRLRVDYRPRASLRALASQYWQYGWWRQRTLRKNRTIGLRQAIVPGMVLAIGASLVAAAFGFMLALAIPAAYLGMLIASAVSARGSTPIERLTMVAALAIMHIVWGFGFMLSFLNSFRAAQETPRTG